MALFNQLLAVVFDFPRTGDSFKMIFVVIAVIAVLAVLICLLLPKFTKKKSTEETISRLEEITPSEGGTRTADFDSAQVDSAEDDCSDNR